MGNKPKLSRKRMRKRKRKRIEEENPSLEISRITSKDRFRDLPSDIIQHILSFGTFKDAVKFCTLSGQWKSLWTSISNLSFHRDGRSTTNFASFVDKALSLYSAPKVKTFLLEFRYDARFNEQVKSWIHFALTHWVEELYVHLIGEGAWRSSKESDWFDNWCGISLKVISLARLLLNKEMIEAIFCGSPLLESLKLQQCFLSESLGNNFLIDATNTRLQNIVLSNCYRAYVYVDGRVFLFEGWVEIRGPNLVSLTLEGYMWDTKFKLVHVSSLVEANIDFFVRVNNHEDKLPVKAVFEKLLHVNRLVIRDDFVQVLRNMSLDGENFSPLKCRILEFNLSRSNWCYSGLEFVLQNSPSLEQLTINMGNLHRYADEVKEEENYWRSNTKSIRCLNHNLERVEIRGFVIGNSSWHGGKILVEVVQFLLDKAKVLQKLTVHARVDKLNRTWKSIQPKELKTLLEDLETLLAINEVILHFPRASPDAVLVLKSGLV